MKCLGTVTKAQHKMAAGSPFSGQSIYETGPQLPPGWLEETVVSLDATGLHIHEVAPRSRAEMVELHTAWTQAARVEATAGRAAAAAAAAAAEAEAEAEAEVAAEAAEAAAEEEELLLGCI